MTKETIEALVVAVLAVNSYPPDKVYALIPSLERELLTVAEIAARMSPAESTIRLARAGYDRGMLTSMMADRLISLMSAIGSGQLDGLESDVVKDDRSAAMERLCRVRGIGRHVASVAWALLVAAHRSVR